MVDGLLPCVRLDHRLDLLLDRVQVEAGRVLHRWIVDGRFREIEYRLLDLDKSPELASEKLVGISRRRVIPALAPEVRGSLERIPPKVNDRRHVRSDLFPRPAPRLLQELELKVVNPNGSHCWAAEVKQLVASRRRLALQQRQLVVAVQMVLVSTFAELHTFQQLLREVGISRRRCERRQPVESGENAVLDPSRLHMSRPADDARHAKTAFKTGAFRGFERRHAAVGPGEYLSAIVR